MYLYGASGHAKVIVETIRSLAIPIEGIFDDNPAVKNLGTYSVASFPGSFDVQQDKLVISIGNNLIRKKLALQLECKFGTAVHPKANISESADIGDGTVVMAGASVNADTIIGKHCIINTNSSIDHDCTLMDFVHISPNATLCGGVIVGEGVHIGAGAVITPGITIGDWAVIGAGSVVIRDVHAGKTVVGNPAKQI